MKFDESQARLRRILEERAQAAVDEAIQSNGQVPADKINALEHLSRLIEINELSRPKSQRRWAIPGLLVLTVSIISLLLFIHVDETEISLDLSSSGLSFIAPPEQQLFPKDGFDLTELGTAGITSTIHLPGTSKIKEQDLFASPVQIKVDPQKTGSGTINLPSLALPVQSHVRVEVLDPNVRSYRIAVKGADPSFRVELDRTVHIESPNKVASDFDITANAAVVHCGTEECDLDLTFRSTKPTILPPLLISDLSLLRLDPLTNELGSVRHESSTILSGKLVFNSLNGRELNLDGGDSIRFDTSTGVIRTLRLLDGHVDLQFTGNVSGLRVSHGQESTTLMPTWLEWLRARHQLSLFWGTSVYVLGILFGAIRWWGKST
ncbi:MAG TPA: hypothetical protein VGD61_11645 [Pyrinomonadaceae bacterium]